MLRFKLPTGVIGVVLGALLMSSPADGSVLQALDLDELVGHSQRIVLGEVLFSQSFERSDGTIGTWHRIRVERDVRGNAADESEVIVETLGGSIGDIAMRVEGEPSFSVGERVLVFIHEGGPYAAFRPVGMGQGVMRVRLEQGVETVTQTRSGMVLMRRDSTGRLVKSRGALPKKERLDQFLTRVRSIVERNAGGIHE